MEEDPSDYEVVEGQITKWSLIEGKPSRFWLSSLSNIDIVFKMNKAINKKKKKVETALQEGEIYGVPYYGRLYRAVILRIEEGSQRHLNKYLVRFIDYGNYKFVTAKSFYEVPHEYLRNIPPQGICCRLNKWHISKDVQLSETEAVKTFKKAFEIDRQDIEVFAVLQKNPDYYHNGQEPEFLADISETKSILEPIENGYVTVSNIEQSPVKKQYFNPMALKKVNEWLNKTTSLSKKSSLSSQSKSDTLTQEEKCVNGNEVKDNSFSSSLSIIPDENTVTNGQVEEVNGSTTMISDKVFEVVKSLGVEIPKKNGDDLRCIISYAVSPDLIYVNLNSKAKEIQELHDQLLEEFGNMSDNFDKMDSYNYAKGSFVAVYNELDGWLRGEILSITPDFKIFLFDFGYEMIIDPQNVVKDLRPLPLKYGYVSKFALPCKLFGIDPLDGNEYSKGAVDYLRNLVERNCTLQIESNEDILPLSVTMKINEETTSVNQALVDMELVKVLDKNESSNWNPMAVDFTAPHNAPHNNHFHPGYDKSAIEEEKQVCKFYRQGGNCARAENCHFLHIHTGMAYLDPFGEDVKTVTHHEARLPTDESVFPIFVPSIRHPNSFYVTVEKDINCDYELLSYDQDLSKLTIELTRYYENDNRNFRQNGKFEFRSKNGPFVTGEIVAVKWTDDSWYRGRILEFFEYYEEDDELFGMEEQVRIFFVDFGCYFDTQVSNVKKIHNQFLKLPFQAIECSLYKVDFPENCTQWPTETCEKFRDLTSNPFLRAKVMSQDGLLPEVVIFVKIDDEWVNVSEELIQLNLASEEVRIKNGGTFYNTVIIPG